MLVSVALGLPRLSPLTYHSPIPVHVGSRVLVPVGKRIVTGMVVGMEPDYAEETRNIIEVLDETPLMPSAILELTKRVAEYYLCSWGEVLMAAMPGGLTPSSVIRVETLKYHTEEELAQVRKRAPRRAELLALLQEQRSDVSVSYLQKKLGTAALTDQLDALQRAGIISVSSAIEGSTKPREVQAVTLAANFPTNRESVAGIFDELDRRAPKQSLVLGQVYLTNKRTSEPIPVGRLANELGTSTQVVMALVDKGLLSVVSIPALHEDQTSPSDLVIGNEGTYELTAEQQQAVDGVAVEGFAPYLLDGVTGSGKTLVYMHVMKKVLALGKSCLMLVPEIALTPQLHDRFRAVFGNAVALIHSRMSMSERVAVWKNVSTGKISVVLGARSSVFVPLPNLGLVVVDEEHEPSYKQDDPAPRYHGRDVALMRAQIEQCPIILGSATPSLESCYNVELRRFRPLALHSRIDGAVLPTITVVSIKDERNRGAMYGCVGHTLLEAIRSRVEKSEGTILFLNRRGFAPQLTCTDCGSVARCPNCDVSLTWHKATGVLRCHYCNHTEDYRTFCKECGSTELHDIGIGTQRVEEDLLRALEPNSPKTPSGRDIVVARMDADTMKKRNAHRDLLTRFARGEVDVLVGTQMVAKGLDFPRVTLVGVVLADQTLNQNDFRAAERTVQLLQQVSGRSGRTASHRGEVIIQTHAPSNTAIQAVAQNSIAEWRTTELEQRREAMYPPFSRFCLIEVNGTVEAEVQHVATVLDKLLPTTHPCLLRYPPSTPAIARIRNRYRRVIVVRNPKAADPSGSIARSVLSAALTDYYKHYAISGVRVTVDVDASGSV